MLSFDDLVSINKAEVIFKVTQGISPIYINEMFQIKGCNSEDAQIQTKILKHQSLN